MSNGVIAKTANDFPLLANKIYGMRLSYLDNAATTQKPQIVIDALCDFYQQTNANTHRGAYYLSAQATTAFEEARNKIKNFINAKHTEECIFVRGATEAINLVAYSYGDNFLKPGDEIILSDMEHHSNLIPWQLLAKRQQLKLRFLPLTASGELDIYQLPSLINNNTKLISIIHASNTLGSITPAKQVIEIARRNNIIVLLDGTQAAAHMPIDVQDLDCDFYVLSAHKMYGPTGIGLLYGKKNILTNMPPFLGGGNMILDVQRDEAIYQQLPYRFEAGTQPIAAAIAWGIAIDYLTQLSWKDINDHENFLLNYARQQLQQIANINILPASANSLPIISFTHNKIHPHDLSTILDSHGVAIRAGHHCTQLIMQHFKVTATARISLSIYNNAEDIDQLIDALLTAEKIFK